MDRNYITLEALQLSADLKSKNYVELFNQNNGAFPLQILHCNNELTLQVTLPNKHLLVQKLHQGTLPQNLKSIKLQHKQDSNVQISFPTEVGTVHIEVTLDLPEENTFVLHVNSNLNCAKEHFHQNDQREVLVLSNDYTIPKHPTLYIEQVEGRTGHCFVDFGKKTKGCLLYIQDLGAIQQMAEQSQVSYNDTVKIEWPQLGFKLPHAKRPLKNKGTYCLQQSFVSYHFNKPKSHHEASDLYLKLLYHIYPHLKKPQNKIIDLVEIANKTLHDLATYKGCWKQVQDAAFLNAYTNSYDTPPESMVQMAILRPLYEYHQRFGNPYSEHIIEELLKNIARFYDDELGIMHRWLPANSYLLDFDEEQKRSFIMDSWYLLYPLLQLVSLFEQGLKNDELKQQLLKSLSYIRKTAKTFNYDWPIFFNIYTLEILKEEGNHDVFGEVDTAGLYIQIMLKSYKLYNKATYLAEAKRAANKLKSVDLDSLYQSNNAAYTAEALLELYVETSNRKYIEIAEIFLGNIIRNCALWDMKYGNAKERESFFGLLPLKRAPYTAAFEEHETVAIFNRIVRLVHQNNITLSKNLLFFVNEYMQYALHRLLYYFPPSLPSDIFADNAKTGYVNKSIYIPIEDIGDGWEALGQVGQEVYGAAAFFNLCIHHVVILYDDCYVISSLPFKQQTRNKQQFKILGVPEQEGVLWIKSANPSIQFEINNKQQPHQEYYLIKAYDTLKFTSK
ncbi:hypothetical protein [Sphingobacterium composti Ten et al. 2007 non Yoo et al. 2007]|uniref:hypothetical protein n=1 Tax=Sphingobacterium composti TaxID=363260 RepID=UPI00135AFE94|nr:hypothetical protein [Sphingobacterium composti Ten et al. 2007 non Yoo et al. 2007]